LFQIVDDPREKQNVAEQHPEVVARLSQMLRAIPVGETGRRRKNVEAGMPNRNKGQNPRKRGGAKQSQSKTDLSSADEGASR